MRPDRVAIAVATFAFAILAVRCAWMSDDAFITLRHVEHLCAGYGLRFNIAERVQGFTHPLWALLLIPGHAITRDPYYPPLFLSLALGVAAVGVTAWRAPIGWSGAAAAIALAGSKGFVDFTTSGLENPLTHLLLALFAVESLGRDRAVHLGLYAGLLASNRLDATLLVAPALAVRAARGDRLQLLWGVVPPLLWHSFALLYYGFPFPNTAYAKLGHGITADERVLSGLRWMAWGARHDPSTACAILCAPLVAFGTRRREIAAYIAGAWLYVGYVVWAGGDFMATRFWSPPMLLVGVAVAHVPVRPALALAAMLTALSVVSPWSPWRAGPAYRRAPASDGVVDERGYYWAGAGWLSNTPGPRPRHRFVATGRRIGASGTGEVVKATVGFVGYYAGPSVHVVDPLGLTDPLLARLPAAFDPKWRIGHFRRTVPGGWADSAASGTLALVDPGLEPFAEALMTITRAPLLSAERWAAMVDYYSGSAAAGLDRAAYRYPEAALAPAAPATIGQDGARFPATPVRVVLGPGRWTLIADRDGSSLAVFTLTAGAYTLDPPEGTTGWFLRADARSPLRVWEPR